jgi:hypothetical protein
MKKFLIAARVDRGGKSVSQGRINALVQELGFDGYYETSAKEGQNIATLAEAVKQTIDWNSLPKVTSTELFQNIKSFLVAEKGDGRLLSTFDDLYRAFLKSEKSSSNTEDLPAQKDFDVFLCHNGKNKDEIKRIGEMLKEQGILPWLDEWELRPGIPWQHLLQQQIKQIKSAAVFVGKDGIGPWQQQEIAAFLREFVKRRCPVIPVLLAKAPKQPRIPPFLEGMTWVDFREQAPDPMARLIWGITGKHDLVR